MEKIDAVAQMASRAWVHGELVHWSFGREPVGFHEESVEQDIKRKQLESIELNLNLGSYSSTTSLFSGSRADLSNPLTAGS